MEYNSNEKGLGAWTGVHFYKNQNYALPWKENFTQ